MKLNQTILYIFGEKIIGIPEVGIKQPFSAILFCRYNNLVDEKMLFSRIPLADKKQVRHLLRCDWTRVTLFNYCLDSFDFNVKSSDLIVMPPLIKLPKYALFDFDNGTVDTGASSLIDTVESEISEQTFDYDASHIIFWPNRAIKHRSQEDIVKLKQCGKILLFGSKYIWISKFMCLISRLLLTKAMFHFQVNYLQ